jgi:hypothetical protein
VIEGVCLESFKESVVILPLSDFGELDVESHLLRGERFGLYPRWLFSYDLYSLLARNWCSHGGKPVFLFLSVLLF